MVVIVKVAVYGLTLSLHTKFISSPTPTLTSTSTPYQYTNTNNNITTNNPFSSLTSTKHFTTLPQLVMRKDELDSDRNRSIRRGGGRKERRRPTASPTL
ncbi:unnamed protein product [Cercopithifilaria johnstoni]|uniref:Uncharacterized protein n=1 Tax=Cercopithifilaria johnstoni TaxID=2874296 RepID=A0A8J2M175_9BILA|nr:unnamed protein product [Cercopithifilaria johnstoni]